MTEREKIIEILKQTSDIWAKEESCGYIVSVDLGKIADTLIEAGIGDKSGYRLFISKDGTEIKQLYSGEEVEQIVKEREEYKHRAEVAERALYKACKDIKDICEYLVKVGGTGVITIESYVPEQSEPSAYIDRAEKELAEEGKDD